MKTRSSQKVLIKLEPDHPLLHDGMSTVPPVEVPVALMPVKSEPSCTRENDLCPVCYLTLNKPSKLDVCDHLVCFECMKAWLENAVNCCTCRQQPKEFVIINPGTEQEEKYPVADIIKAKEARQREQAGSHVPLTLERAIIRKAKHEYQVLIENMDNPPAVPRREGLYGFRRARSPPRRNRRSGQYREWVDAQNGLNLLLDTTDRKAVVSNKYFRTLIYKYDCEWYSATEDVGTSYRPDYAREHQETERARIESWIVQELDYVVFRSPPTVYVRHLSKREKKNAAEMLFKRVLDMAIHSPLYYNILVREVGLEPRSAERFQHELFNFAASRFSEAEYYTISCYKMPGINDFAVGGLNQMNTPELVTLDDGPETREDNGDVMVVHEQINPVQRLNQRPESNYVRDEQVISSGSERDDLFQRRACRINIPTFPPIQFPLPPFHPGTGIAYTSAFARPEPSVTPQNLSTALEALINTGAMPQPQGNRQLRQIPRQLQPQRPPSRRRREPIEPSVDVGCSRTMNRLRSKGRQPPSPIVIDDEPTHAVAVLPPPLLAVESSPRPEREPYTPQSPVTAYEPTSPTVTPYRPTSPAINRDLMESSEEPTSSDRGARTSRPSSRKIEKYQKGLEKQMGRLTSPEDIQKMTEWLDRHSEQMKSQMVRNPPREPTRRDISSERNRRRSDSSKSRRRLDVR